MRRMVIVLLALVLIMGSLGLASCSTHKIYTLRITTSPTDLAWSGSYATTSSWISSRSLTSSKKCRTWFEFRDEYWVLEEEDGDIKGLWHTVEKWIETEAYMHVGGAESGATVYGDKYGYSTVTSPSKPYGYFFTISPGNGTSKAISGTQTYSYAFSTPLGFSASASTTYNSAYQFSGGTTPPTSPSPCTTGTPTRESGM